MLHSGRGRFVFRGCRLYDGEPARRIGFQNASTAADYSAARLVAVAAARDRKMLRRFCGESCFGSRPSNVPRPLGGQAASFGPAPTDAGSAAGGDGRSFRDQPPLGHGDCIFRMYWHIANVVAFHCRVDLSWKGGFRSRPRRSRACSGCIPCHSMKKPRPRIKRMFLSQPKRVHAADYILLRRTFETWNPMASVFN